MHNIILLFHWPDQVAVNCKQKESWSLDQSSALQVGRWSSVSTNWPFQPYSLIKYTQSLRLFLFPKLKFYLKGSHFGMVENIEKAVTEQLKAILVNDFQRWYEEWEQRLWRCVASQGNYFEGDKSICSLKINTELYWISFITLFTDLILLCI